MKPPIPFDKQIQEYERRDRLNGVQRRFIGDLGRIGTKEASDEYRRGYSLAFDCPRGKHEWETVSHCDEPQCAISGIGRYCANCHVAEVYDKTNNKEGAT